LYTDDLKTLIALVIVITSIILLVLSQIQSPRYVDALQQIAGSIIIKIKPGETKTFKWGLMTDQNESKIVPLSADGSGANYLSFPKSIKLSTGNLTYVLIKVSIPKEYIGNATLNPTIRATEAGENKNGTILNIAMAKHLSIVINENVTTGKIMQNLSNSS
jgi:hypothetical protein